MHFFSMYRYLTIDQAKTNLRLGKPVEQWLTPLKKEDYTIVRWIRIDKESDNTYSVSRFEVIDEGDESFSDVYDFTPLNPDEPYGDIQSFENPNDALEYACKTFGLDKSKFVNAGIIQDEYLDFVSKG